MATLTIRNLSDEIRDRLRVRAALNRNSMEEEVRVILEHAVAGVTGPEVLERMQEFFSPEHGVEPEQPKREFTMTKKGRIEDMDRSFDIEFWQRQSPAIRMAAVWELTVFHHKLKKRDLNELRLNRTVGGLRSREY